MLTSPLRVLAHELKSPLATSRSAVATLLAGDLGPLTPDQRDYLESVLQLDEFMIGLVGSWGEMERLASGGVTLELEQAELLAVVRGAVAELAPLARSHRTSIDVQSGRQWPVVLADPLRLTQVLINVLDNAVRHNRRGSHIQVRCRVARGSCTLTIHVAAPSTAKQRAQMVAALSSHEAPVTTLGLRIAKMLAEAHGGSLQLDPHTTSGTKFHLRLPVANQMSLLDVTSS